MADHHGTPGPGPDAELQGVVDRECSLLDPLVRADSAAVRALLHPDFLEFGASGRIWELEPTLASLRDDPSVSGVAAGFQAHRLADDVVLLTFRIEGARPSLRSSVWVRDETGAWRLRFHQGTLS